MSEPDVIYYIRRKHTTTGAGAGATGGAITISQDFTQIAPDTGFFTNRDRALEVLQQLNKRENDQWLAFLEKYDMVPNRVVQYELASLHAHEGEQHQKVRELKRQQQELAAELKRQLRNTS